MDLLEHNPHERSNDIDNLIIAAAAASGDEPMESDLPVEECVQYETSEGVARSGQTYWHPSFLHSEHVAAIQEAARSVLADNPRDFRLEPYSKKIGSELDYQEMMDLMDFKCDEEEPVDRIDALRKHSMVFEASGAHSSALPLYEQAVNEAACHICTMHPAAMFHKRDLAMLSKMAVRLTGFEFPSSRAANYTPLDDYTSGGVGMGGSDTDVSGHSLRPSTAAPASASMLLQKSGFLAPRRDGHKPRLTQQEYAIIARAAQDMAAELPNLALKSRDQCSLVENFVYTDAMRLMNISPERLDEEMDYIRDVSAIHGRYQSGPRMPNPRLSPYQLGVNEAAACIAKLRPSLLTHTLHLAEWAKRVLGMTGLQLSRTPVPPSPTHQGDRWSHRGGPAKSASSQLRFQGGGDSAFGGSVAYSTEYLGDYGNPFSGGGVVDPNAPGGGVEGSGNMLDYELSSGLDSSELIQPLGGPQAIAQLSDFNLEKLGRAQFTVVDPRADAEFENCPLELAVEEDDTPLDAAEILRLSGAESLDKVLALSVPCCGYTSVNAFDLTRCINLRELDLSENALRVFPRRLHLSNLRKLGLTGNRFIHLPLIEQFPKLSGLTIDEKLKQLLNPQMLAYFCPKLKTINNQYFDDACSDFTIRVIQEARAIMEPYIHTKWETEFASRLQTTSTREERLRTIETMIQQLREKNFMLDETVHPYKNLLAYRIIDEYLRSKQTPHQCEAHQQHGQIDRSSSATTGAGTDEISAEQRQCQTRATELAAALEAEVPMDDIADEDDDGDMLSGVVGSTGRLPEREAVVLDEEEEQLDTASRAHGDEGAVAEEEDEEDEEERETEARIAGERALFEAADELLGVNFPDSILAQNQQQQQYQNQQHQQGQQHPVQMTLVLDNHGRVTQQQVIPVSAAGSLLGQQQQGLQQQHQPYQMHLGKSLRAGKSIVMTIVRPSGISGRPVAEFLPGELRNKDYVKGYMASEIYKKAVKDTLGQKATPRKRHGPGRPRKSEPATTATGGRGPAAAPGPAMVPFGELNPCDLGSIKKPSIAATAGAQSAVNASAAMASSRSSTSAKKAAAAAASLMALEDLGGSAAGLPPRPKKRKPLGMHRSLRDLCSEPAYGFTPSYLTQTGTGLGGVMRGAAADPGATMIDYDPLHFIRCHAKDNDAGDSETKVWRCLFEPNPLRPEETTHVVATCGGECVCLINCETGKVMKRFKHMEEEFYTIAWTTVEVEGNKRTNILAAAGCMREIRLLHPEQLVCYAEMKGHTEDITAMIFHQSQPTILFSGDSKASVIVWDIGVPSVPDYKTRYQLLMRLRCPRLDVNPVLNLVFLPHYAYLIAGCEDGLFAWKITDLRLEKREREPDMELKLEFDHEVCIDGLAQLSDNSLVIKVVESGEILVFDFAAVLERRKGLQRVVPIEMRGHLYWQKTDEIYINVSVRQNLGAVLCGDNEGAIWIYDLDPYLDDLHSSSRKKFYVKPIKILEWPECSVQGNRDEDQQLKESITSGFRNPVVNSVEMSSDGHFLAAVTDNNLVCIWRYAPPPAAAATTAGAPPAGTPLAAAVDTESILINIPAVGGGALVPTEAMIVDPTSAISPS